MVYIRSFSFSYYDCWSSILFETILRSATCRLNLLASNDEGNCGGWNCRHEWDRHGNIKCIAALEWIRNKNKIASHVVLLLTVSHLWAITFHLKIENSVPNLEIMFHSSNQKTAAGNIYRLFFTHSRETKNHSCLRKIHFNQPFCIIYVDKFIKSNW